MTYPKPMPAPDSDTAPFWEGCRAHRLLIQRCASCATFRFPPGPFCPKCRSKAVEWVQSSGRGTVFSWIVVEHPVPPDIYGAEVPYVVALIALEEGVRIASNIVGCDPYSIAADMPVRVRFDDVDERLTLPRFEPAGAS